LDVQVDLWLGCRQARARAEREQARREEYEQEKKAVGQAILPYSFNEPAYEHRDLWQKAKASDPWGLLMERVTSLIDPIWLRNPPSKRMIAELPGRFPAEQRA
jgi:hypothetical protein